MLESFVGIGGEALLAASAGGEAPERRGNLSPRWAPQGVYACSGDDEWLALSVRSSEEWDDLVEIIRAPPLGDRRFQDLAVRRLEHPYIDGLISAWTGCHTKWEACRLLTGRGIPAMPVMSSADLVHDPHLNHRGFIVEWDQPGIGPRLYPGVPLRFDPPFKHELLPSAPLGRDNREILRDLLHYEESAIDDLERRGVLTTRPEE